MTNDTETKEIDDEGYEIEVLGTCMTNDRPDSEYVQIVEWRYLWSYAQEAALMAVSEPGDDKCWRLIKDPERRAKRIAGHYAELYFKSAEVSKGEVNGIKQSKRKVQFYWSALAAFVVKDIVGAFEYSRENVFDGGFLNYLKTSAPAHLYSYFKSDADVYEHAMRAYIALAKGNLWLFMDIYPWLWFFLEYGIKKSDGTVKKETMDAAIGERNADTLQNQSKNAVKALPFGRAWLQEQQKWQAADHVWERAEEIAFPRPSWGSMGSSPQASFIAANWHVRNNVAKDEHDISYRYLMPTAPNPTIQASSTTQLKN